METFQESEQSENIGWLEDNVFRPQLWIRP